jgi:hypothetical protein
MGRWVFVPSPFLSPQRETKTMPTDQLTQYGIVYITQHRKHLLKHRFTVWSDAHNCAEVLSKYVREAQFKIISLNGGQ